MSEIETILFDMIGPLLQKKENSKEDKRVRKAERLRENSNSDEEWVKKLIEKGYKTDKIIRDIANSYCKISYIWENLLPKLKEKYKLAVINNGSALTIPYFKKNHNFSRSFDVFINSSEERLEKPDPAIFDLICNRLDTDIKKCILIDDKKENVIGAKEIGMKGIKYESPSQLANILNKLRLI